MPARHTRRAALSLGAMGAAAAFLAGCGLLGGEPAGVLSAPPKEPSGKRGGDLRIGFAGPTGDPVGLSDAVYSRLVAMDPRDGKVYGDLASGFEVAPDALTVTVHLREGMRFHPNAQNLADSLTADNVRREFAERGAAGEYLFGSVFDRLEAPDTQTLVLHLRAPFSLLFDYLADTSTAGVHGLQRYSVTNAPLGSGPFVPAGLEDVGMTLVANPLYYRPRLPMLERVYLFDGGPPRDLSAAVVAGELDVAIHGVDAPAEQVKLPRGASATLVKRTSRRMRALGFSLAAEKAGGVQTRAVPAFRDARVRRAASLALDRKAIADLDGGTIAGPVGPAHPGDALPVDELAKHPLYRHDPAEARKLLDAAGIPELSFALEGASRPQTRDVLQLVEKQLREVGFAPRPRLLPVADWERLFLAGDFEVALVEFAELRTPDLGLRLCMSGGLSGSFSLWGFSNPTYDAAARKAFTEVDPKRRGERSRAAQRVLLDEVPPLLPLTSPPDYVTVAPTVQGFEFDAFEFNTTWNAAAWRLNGKK
ncbi:MAG: ABC transporter substrate-binding protein [Dehalococcoidia bacterium]